MKNKTFVYDVPKSIVVNGVELFPALYNLEAIELYLTVIEKLKPYKVKE